MRISELISHLESIFKEQGDAEVYFYGMGAYHSLSIYDCEYQTNEEDWRADKNVYPTPGIYFG